MTAYKLPEPEGLTDSERGYPFRQYTSAQMRSAYNQGRTDQRKEQEELERLYDSVRVAMLTKPT